MGSQTRLILGGVVLVSLAIAVGVFFGLRTRRTQPSAIPATDATTPTAPSTTTPAISTTTVPPATSPPTTTAPLAVPLHEIDFYNRTYELDCTGEYGSIPVRDGRWTSPEGPEYGSLNSFDVAFADVTGDGEQNALVQYSCSVGVSTQWSGTLVFESTPDGLRQIGQPIPGWSEFVDGALVTTTPYYLPEDARCCPSMLEHTTWVLRHGGWDSDEVARIPYPN